MNAKRDKVCLLLSKWGFKNEARKIKRLKFGDNAHITQTVNMLNLNLKVRQWDSILSVLNEAEPA